MSRRYGTGGVIFVIVALIVVAFVLVLSRGDANEGTASASAGSSAEASEPTPSPTPSGPTLEDQRIAWAGDVCVARDRLRGTVTSLGSDLDVQVGPGMLDDLDRQVRLQLLSVGAAASDLAGIVTEAPVEVTEVNDWAETITEPQQRLQASIDATRGHLDAMAGASGVLEGVGEAGSVITSGAAAVAAGQELLDALQQVYADAESRFAPAFAAAPECEL
jgi:hypothetical protein